MQKTTIPGTDLTVSRFIFGTSSLFSAGSRKRRRTLLEAAVAAGFSHFDTAPSYGFGWAERDLAPVLAAFPETGVTTKAGLYAPGGENQPRWTVLARKAAGKVIPRLSRLVPDRDITRARLSLDASLSRLGRERVDLFLLHEVDHAALRTDEWLRWLEDEQGRGRVRHFGLAVAAGLLQPFLDTQSPLAAVVQAPDSLASREADILLKAGRPLQITHGYLSSARGAGPFDPDATLDAALARNRDGAIIVSTGEIGRLAQYPAALARVSGLPVR